MLTGIECPREIPGNVSNNNLHIDRASRLLKSLHIIHTPAEQETILTMLTSVTRPTVVSFVNAHALNLAWEHAPFAENLLRSHVLLRDGIGVQALMNALGIKTGLNMNGTDFIPAIVPSFAGKRIAICGTREPFLSLAADKVRQMGGNVVLVMHGFAELEEYVSAIEQATPDLVILGMGMPKQETLSIVLSERLSQPMVILNGGAILDFWANRFPRAPRIWQQLKLEWLFRMLMEPRRLWKRYILGGFSFASRLVQLRMSGNFAQQAAGPLKQNA